MNDGISPTDSTGEVGCSRVRGTRNVMKFHDDLWSRALAGFGSGSLRTARDAIEKLLDADLIAHDGDVVAILNMNVADEIVEHFDEGIRFSPGPVPVHHVGEVAIETRDRRIVEDHRVAASLRE